VCCRKVFRTRTRSSHLFFVCCSVLQCVAVESLLYLRNELTLIRVLQCIAVCCSGKSSLPAQRANTYSLCVAVCCIMMQCVAVESLLSLRNELTLILRVLQCIAVCCSESLLSLRNELTPILRVLQCVALCCSMLQWRVFSTCATSSHPFFVCCSVLQCVAVHCSALQCVAVKSLLHLRNELTPILRVLQCIAVCCSGKSALPAQRVHTRSSSQPSHTACAPQQQC